MREKRGWLSEIEREAFAAGSTEMGFQFFFCLGVFKEIAAKKHKANTSPWFLWPAKFFLDYEENAAKI